MSSIAVEPNAFTGATVTIKLDHQTLAAQADIVSKLAVIIGAKTIDVDARGVGIGLADQIIKNQITVVSHHRGFPA